MSLDLDPRNIFRDFVIDGMSASGVHSPRKVEIRQWTTGIWRAVIALVADANPDLTLPNLLIRYTVTGGTANALEATPNLTPPVGPGLALFAIQIVQENTGAVTVNGKSLRTNSGNEIAPGGLPAGGVVAFLDLGDHFRLLSDIASGSIVAAAEAAQVAAEAARNEAEAIVGFDGTAESVGYEGASSGLEAANVQGALDELAAGTAVNHDTFLTGKVRVSGDGASTPENLAILSVNNPAENSCGFRVRSYWSGGSGSPFQNHDSLLSEVHNTVISTSLNQSWGGSFANAYNNIPVGVTDTGVRTGILGWAVSVNIPGYNHAGTLDTQIGVQGRAGFQGPGSPVGAKINGATGVRGEVWNDSAGTTIQTAIAGAFSNSGFVGTVVDNYAIFARARDGTGKNWSFYGEAGDLFNAGGITTEGNIHLVEGGTEAQIFNNGTNAGFATNASRSAGQFMSINGSTWTSLSDKRVKEDILTVSILDKLENFRAVTYVNTLTHVREFGVIAQELATCFPEFVVQGNDDPSYVPSGFEDAHAWKVTGYERMGAYALQGVKELLQTVQALEAELQSLRRRVENFEAAN